MQGKYRQSSTARCGVKEKIGRYHWQPSEKAEAGQTLPFEGRTVNNVLILAFMKSVKVGDYFGEFFKGLDLTFQTKRNHLCLKAYNNSEKRQTGRTKRKNMTVYDLVFSPLHFFLLNSFWLFLLNMHILKMRSLDIEGGRGPIPKGF